MIVRIKRYSIKEAVLKIAKKEGMMNYGGMKVRIFPNLTMEMAKKRATFHGVKAKLCEEGIKHGLIYAATLIIPFNGETKYFQDHRVTKTYNSVVKTYLNEEIVRMDEQDFQVKLFMIM